PKFFRLPSRADFGIARKVAKKYRVFTVAWWTPSLRLPILQAGLNTSSGDKSCGRRVRTAACLPIRRFKLQFANASNLVPCGREMLSAQSGSLPGFIRLA